MSFAKFSNISWLSRANTYGKAYGKPRAGLSAEKAVTKPEDEDVFCVSSLVNSDVIKGDEDVFCVSSHVNCDVIKV